MARGTPHARKHRVRHVLLEDAYEGRPPWLAREREKYLASVENIIEAMRRAVRTPPKGVGEDSLGTTPWVVPKPKPARRNAHRADGEDE